MSKRGEKNKKKFSLTFNSLIVRAVTLGGMENNKGGGSGGEKLASGL